MPDPEHPTKPEVAEQAKLLSETLPDAHLTIAQEVKPKATHGREEVRTVWVIESADLNAYVGSSGTVGKPWPGVAQVARIQRVVTKKDRKSGQPKTTAEVGYAITSMAGGKADAQGVLWRWRVHWHIENRLHWVRDVTFGEDESQIHLGQAPQVFSILRNAAISLLGMGDYPSKAEGVLQLGSRPEAALEMFNELAHKLSHSQPRQVQHPRNGASRADPPRHPSPPLQVDGTRHPLARAPT